MVIMQSYMKFKSTSLFTCVAHPCFNYQNCNQECFTSAVNSCPALTLKSECIRWRHAQAYLVGVQCFHILGQMHIIQVARVDMEKQFTVTFCGLLSYIILVCLAGRKFLKWATTTLQ